MSRWKRRATTGVRCGGCWNRPASSWCWSTLAMFISLPGRKTDVADSNNWANHAECGVVAVQFHPAAGVSPAS